MKLDIVQISFFHPTLRKILIQLEGITGIEFTITSLYREKSSKESGIHSTIPLRAVDLRIHDVHIGHVIEARINNNWQYDPMRKEKKVALLHGKSMHLHIQVHDNTKRI